MQKLEAWLDNQGYVLSQQPGVADCAIVEGAKLVLINRARPYETRLGTLLHECGHVEIHRRRKRRVNCRIAGSSIKEKRGLKGRCKPRTLARDISELDEEIEAWEVGTQLAKALEIKYNRKKFERLRERCLMTYVLNVSRRRNKK